MTAAWHRWLDPGKLGRVAGCTALLVAWHLAATHGSPILVSAPGEAFRALLSLLTHPRFLTSHVLPTWSCAAVALSIAFLSGTGLGLLTGRSRFLTGLFEPLRWILVSVPAVVVVIVGMLWFGLGARSVIVMTSVLLFPFSYVTSADAVRNLPPTLLEVAAVYKFSRSVRYLYVFIPAIRGAIVSGLTLLAGNSIRVTVLCELLGTDGGLGYELAAARSRLDAPRLWGVCLLCILLVTLTERALAPWVGRVVRSTSRGGVVV